MAGRSSDSISLQTINAIDVDEIPDVLASDFDDQSRNHINDGAGDKDDDEPLPDAFNTKSLLLWAPPALSGEPSYAAKKWKTSQVYRSLAIVSCLWICLGCHFFFTKPTTRNMTGGYRRWIPSFLATVLPAFCSHVGHSDMLLYSSHSSHRSTYRAILFVVCVIGPILSMPMLGSNAIPGKHNCNRPFEELLSLWQGVGFQHPRFESVTGRTYNIGPSYYPMYYNSLLSWDQVIGTVSFWPPILGQENLPSSHHPPSQWTIKDRRTLDRLPSTSTSFTLYRNGTGPNESTWNDDPRENTAAIMPMTMTTNQSLGWNIAMSRAEGYGQALAITLECDIVSLHVDRQNEVTGSTVEVTLVDSNGCFGVIELKERLATHEMGSMMDILAKARADIIGSAKNEAALQRTLSYLDAYSEALNLTSTLKAYRPGWLLAEGSHKLCRRKILMAATTRAIIANEINLRPQDIQAASCTPHYYSSNVTILFTQYMGDRIQREPDLIFNALSVHFDDIFLEDDPYRWDVKQPGDGMLEVFDEFFFRHVLTVASQPNISPRLSVHVQDELSDIYWDRPIPVGSLLMSSRFLRSSFTEGMTSAATLALEETLGGGNSSKKQEVLVPNIFSIDNINKNSLVPIGSGFLTLGKRFAGGLGIGVLFIARWGLWMFLLCTSIIVSRIIINEFATYSDLELPLDRRPIATRAALLCNSTIRAWLREMRDVSTLGSLASTLYFSFWAVDRVQGRSGLRIEYLATPREGTIPSR